MRILFLTHYFPPEGNAPASRVYETAKRWVAAGHEVQVITCAPNVPTGVVYEGYVNRLKQTEFIDGIRVTRVWTYIAANRGKLRRSLNYISFLLSATLAGLFVKRPDVLIATSPQFFCGWAGVFLSKLRRLPFVLEIRDIWPASIVAVGAMKRGPLLRCMRYAERKMYRSADHIVTVGDGYKNELLDRSVPEEKVSVVMNGVDREIFRPDTPADGLRERLGINGEFVCSYIGTVGMASGLAVVLRAGKLLQEEGRDDIRFLIVGDGAVRAELEAEARRMGLRNVLFAGQQRKGQIPRYLSMTDACLVHLKNSDLFRSVMPSKIFEAAGMAKPVIIGVRGFAERFVLGANAGVAIEPENERELVGAVLDLADHPERGPLYGDAGYRYVTANHTRDKLAEDYLAVLSDTVVGLPKDCIRPRLFHKSLSKTPKILDVCAKRREDRPLEATRAD
jgi:glycosyltransferase involved in cell wall biosynthesis